MASKRDRERQAARTAKKASGRPALSRYAAKGGPFKYEFQERERQPRSAR
jgi:hypothetical protein